MNERITVLDKGYVQLIDTWGSDERIIEAARMSTQKGFEGWGPKCPNESKIPGQHIVDLDGIHCENCGAKFVAGDEKLLAYLWKNNHATPFEMAGITIEVQAPIVVFREWHRHRVPFGYNEASARYAPLPSLDYVPTVDRLMQGGGHLTKQAGAVADSLQLTASSAGEWIERLCEVYTHAERVYQDGLRLGVPKELARLSMTVGRYSKMRATGNLRGWLGLLALRMPVNVQWEFREYAGVVHKILHGVFPRTLSLFDETRSKA